MHARQNDAAEYSENDGSLFRITSTQAMTTRDKPKPLNTLLNPAGSGDTAAMPCAFLMSRARRFIPITG